MNKKGVFTAFIVLILCGMFGVFLTLHRKAPHTSPNTLYEKIMCKNTLFEVWLRYDPNYFLLEFDDILLKGTREDEDIVLRFSHGAFGMTCVNSNKEKPYFVFQKYCQGSGCKDLDNWGVIDPETLDVLLVPHVDNQSIVKQLLGFIPKPLEMYRAKINKKVGRDSYEN